MYGISVASDKSLQELLHSNCVNDNNDSAKESNISMNYKRQKHTNQKNTNNPIMQEMGEILDAIDKINDESLIYSRGGA